MPYLFPAKLGTGGGIPDVSLTEDTAHLKPLTTLDELTVSAALVHLVPLNVDNKAESLVITGAGGTYTVDIENHTGSVSFTGTFTGSTINFSNVTGTGTLTIAAGFSTFAPVGTGFEVLAFAGHCATIDLSSCSTAVTSITFGANLPAASTLTWDFTGDDVGDLSAYLTTNTANVAGGTINLGTHVYTRDTITAITDLVGSGSGYSTANDLPTSSNGAGTGLTLNIVSAAGAVDSYTIGATGSGHANGDVITILAGNSDASGTLVFEHGALAAFVTATGVAATYVQS